MGLIIGDGQTGNCDLQTHVILPGQLDCGGPINQLGGSQAAEAHHDQVSLGAEGSGAGGRAQNGPTNARENWGQFCGQLHKYINGTCLHGVSRTQSG